MGDENKTGVPAQGAIPERAQDIIGLPVIEIENGATLGEVVDIWCRDGAINGFLIAGPGGQPGFIPITAAMGVGSGAVTIQSSDVIVRPDADPGLAAAAAAGSKVLTASGNELGSVQDVVLDLETGRVLGLELSDGLIRDVLEGRTILPLSGIVSWGENTVIADNRFTDIWSKGRAETVQDTGKGG